MIEGSSSQNVVHSLLDIYGLKHRLYLRYILVSDETLPFSPAKSTLAIE